METRADRLKWTKVYHGEKECPKEIEQDPDMLFFWDAEKVYVEDNARAVNFVKSYLKANNSGLSHDYPIDLLATLYAYAIHGDNYSNDPMYLGAWFRTEIFPLYEQLTSK